MAIAMTDRMRFRPHRSTLAESMAETVEVANRVELTAHLEALYPEILCPRFGDRPSVIIKPYGHDPRIDWDYTYIVEAVGIGPLGFCDRAIPSEP